jgi:RNA polymerase sigma-70 factor (ECF subfamily)
MSGENEAKLIKSCIRQYRQSQKELYDMFGPEMFAICLKYYGQFANAEDALQKGFIKVFNDLNTYKKDEPLKDWVRKIFVSMILENMKSGQFQTNPETV